jgi:hypothetical protein
VSNRRDTVTPILSPSPLVATPSSPFQVSSLMCSYNSINGVPGTPCRNSLCKRSSCLCALFAVSFRCLGVAASLLLALISHPPLTALPPAHPPSHAPANPALHNSLRQPLAARHRRAKKLGIRRLHNVRYEMSYTHDPASSNLVTTDERCFFLCRL